MCLIKIMLNAMLNKDKHWKSASVTNPAKNMVVMEESLHHRCRQNTFPRRNFEGIAQTVLKCHLKQDDQLENEKSAKNMISLLLSSKCLNLCQNSTFENYKNKTNSSHPEYYICFCIFAFKEISIKVIFIYCWAFWYGTSSLFMQHTTLWISNNRQCSYLHKIKKVLSV